MGPWLFSIESSLKHIETFWITLGQFLKWHEWNEWNDMYTSVIYFAVWLQMPKNKCSCSDLKSNHVEMNYNGPYWIYWPQGHGGIFKKCFLSVLTISDPKTPMSDFSHLKKYWSVIYLVPHEKQCHFTQSLFINCHFKFTDIMIYCGLSRVI